MKKNIFITIIISLMLLPVFGQKYAYIDSEYILGNMPDYVEAQAELDRIAAQWQKEIEAQFKSIDSMYKKYQVEQITLPDVNNTARTEIYTLALHDAKNM